MRTIEQILTGQPVLLLSPETSALEASQAMAKRHGGAVLVDRGPEELPGIFTERDLMTRVVALGKAPESVAIGTIQTVDVVTASCDESVAVVAKRMSDRHIRHLPVVQDGKVVCLLSFRDLLRALLDEKAGEVDAMTAYIQGETDAPGS